MTTTRRDAILTAAAAVLSAIGARKLAARIEPVKVNSIFSGHEWTVAFAEEVMRRPIGHTIIVRVPTLYNPLSVTSAMVDLELVTVTPELKVEAENRYPGLIALADRS